MANTAVFGIYAGRTQVEMAVDLMKVEGFRNSDISVLPPIDEGKKTKAPEEGAGVTVGGIGGTLIGMGMPEYEAKRFESRVKGGHILLSVRCDNSEWTKKARRILERSGAEDISSISEKKAA
jgi:hypothetical protein